MVSCNQGATAVLAVLGVTILGATLHVSSNLKASTENVQKSVTTKYQMKTSEPSGGSAGQLHDFSQDEILYFTTGVGNATNLQKRLPIYIRNQMSKPSEKFLRSRTPGSQVDYSQGSKSALLDKLMGGKKNGFFIECGALDGTSQSNSVYFELTRNWSGLLIEGNLHLRPKLLNLGRNAYILNSCISTRTTPMLAKFKIEWGVGGLSDTLNDYAKNKLGGNMEILISCYPFGSILDAIGVRHVDLMTLDVEGSEMEIIKTIDFNRYKIDTFMVEFAMWPSSTSVAKSAVRLEKYRQFFNDLGIYKEVAITRSEGGKVAMDIVYQRKDYLAARSVS